MMSSKKHTKIYFFGWYVLAGYFVLYELTTSYATFNSTIVNLFALGVVALSCALYFLGMIIEHKGLTFVGLIWMPFLFVLAYHMMNYLCAKSYFFLFVLFILMLFAPVVHENLWDSIIKMFRVIAVLCAWGVLLQVFLPSVHKMIVSIYLNDGAVTYINNYAAKGYYSGFLHQVGSNAFYLSVGIIAEIFSNRTKNKKIITVLFLGITLLLQGKRSLFLFLILSVLIAYMLLGNQKQIVKRIIAISIFAIVFWTIMEEVSFVLSDIKLFEKLAQTMSFLDEGNVSGMIEQSGRNELYDLAIKLYEQQPMYGIGWGGFSKMAGIVYENSTSVHNIYLQLLCETGLVGLITFLIGAVVSLILCVSVRGLLRQYEGENKQKYERIFAITVAGQILFLTFGFVENPLYNENCIIFYFFMIILTFALRTNIKIQKCEKKAPMPR